MSRTNENEVVQRRTPLTDQILTGGNRVPCKAVFDQLYRRLSWPLASSLPRSTNIMASNLATRCEFDVFGSRRVVIRRWNTTTLPLYAGFQAFKAWLPQTGEFAKEDAQRDDGTNTLRVNPPVRRRHQPHPEAIVTSGSLGQTGGVLRLGKPAARSACGNGIEVPAEELMRPCRGVEAIALRWASWQHALEAFLE